MPDKRIEVKDVKGVVNAESGATINQHFHSEKSNKKYYYLLGSIVVISIFTIWSISHMNVTNNSEQIINNSGNIINNSKNIINNSGNVINNSGNIINNSGKIVMDYSTKIYKAKEKEKKYEMEFLDLLTMFASDDGSEWSVGAEKDSEINWLYSGRKGIKSVSQDLPKTFGSYIREGRVSILNKGKPSHTILEKTKNPVKWDIKLFGTRNDVNTITLSNSVYSPNGGRLKIPSKLLSHVKDICEDASYFALSLQLYEVNMLNKKKLWIVEHSDGGSAGMIYSYTIFLYKPSSEKMKEVLSNCI